MDFQTQTQLDAQCNGARTFPLNSAVSTYAQESRYKALNDEEHRLFSAENKAALDFLDFGKDSKGTPRLTIAEYSVDEIVEGSDS